MTARAHLTKGIVRTVSGGPASGQVRVLVAGGTEDIGVPIYSGPTGSSTRSNPFTFSNGVIDFYLEDAMRVKLVVTPAGGTAQTFDDVDVINVEEFARLDGAVFTGPIEAPGVAVFGPTNKPAADVPSSYPLGLSSHHTTTGTAAGWPANELMVVTSRRTEFRIVQFAVARTTGNVWVRSAASADEWGDFMQLAGSDGADFTGPVTGTSISVQLPDGKLASALPDTYPAGLSTVRVTAEAGWPSTNGGVLTFGTRDTGGIKVQIFYSANGTSQTRVGTSNAWTPFVVDAVDPSTDDDPSTIALRSGSGDLTARLFRSTYTGGAGSSADVAFILAQREQGDGDNYARPMPLATLKTALAVPSTVTGTYTGDGTADRTISLGFTPKMVFLSGGGGHASQSGPGTGASLNGMTRDTGGGIVVQNTRQWRPEIVSGGFRIGVSGANALHTNASGDTYTYTAIG